MTKTTQMELTDHPNRSQSHMYTVRAYSLRGGKFHEVLSQVIAADALAALAMVSGRRDHEYANHTRRWQNSPVAADRDNCHAQANGAGTIGWAVTRVDLDPVAADHRNDVRDRAALGSRRQEIERSAGIRSLCLGDRR